MTGSLKWVELYQVNDIIRLEDLDQAIETYNSDRYKAPLVIHDVFHGYPVQIGRVGDRFLAGFEKLTSKAQKWIDDDALEYRVSFYLPSHPSNPSPGKWSLQLINAVLTASRNRVLGGN